jgi:outer membrane protein assembly factor BamA
LLFLKKYRFVWMLLSVLLLSACSVTKTLHEDEVLVKKNKVSGIDKKAREEMKLLIRPRANRKFLGLFRIKASVYQRTGQGRPTNFKESLRSSFGEPPALVDSTSIKESAANIQRYLADKGYFYGTLEAEVEPTKRNPKKATVHFRIAPGPQYTFRKIEFEPTRSQIDEFVAFHMLQSNSFLLVPNQPFDADKIASSRTQLANYLREMGFFYFNRDLIYFEVDSALGTKQVDVKIKIKRPREPFVFEQFAFDSIFVNVDFQAYQSQNDTLVYDTIQRNDYIFVDRSPQSIRKDILVQNMLFKKDLIFSESAMRLTQSRISDLKVFGYNNIRLQPNDSLRKLNIIVNLSPANRRQLKLESEVSTNSISLFGIAGSVTETRRNVFKGAEILEIRANAGIESQQNVSATDVLSRTTFNTLEYGLSMAITIPRFLWPFHTWNERFYTAPRTRFGIRYNRQIRLDFTREVLQANVGYLWMNKARERYEFFPAEISLARTARVSDNLSNLLEQLNDPFLQFSFTNYINLATRFAYSVDNLSRRGTFMRVNFEYAGNTLHAIYNLLEFQTDDPTRRFLGLPYFQYVRADVEYRKYWKHSDASTLASRIFVGAGLPLQNSIIMPLEKRYFAGGTNSIRAWLARELGPGGFGRYGQRLDQFGEIRLEGNLEERFPIIGKFQGAIFLDAGNIWTLKDTTAVKRDLANFQINRFYREIAIGTGFGLRYDFEYFVFRIDIGIKAHDPAFNAGDRWVISNLFNRNWIRNDWRGDLNIPLPENSTLRYPFTSFNVGINYPF